MLMLNAVSIDRICSGASDASSGATVARSQNGFHGDIGESPDYGMGVIAQDPFHCHINPLSAAVDHLPDLSGCSRSNILRSAVSLCSATHMPLDQKVDNMMSLVGHLVQLLLLEHNSGSGSSLNQSWVTASSNTSSGNPDAVSSAAAIVTAGAVKAFRCPVCPGSKRLTEKGFQKHVVAWRNRPKAVGKRQKKPTCPGIFNHPVVHAGVMQGSDAADVVDRVVNRTLKMLNPGANAAHGLNGTGNHAKVDAYFSQLFAQYRQ
jgi:hypothetical protein